MASEDDAIWHILINGAQRGPLRRSQLLASLRDGTVNGAGLVWRPGFENWLPLRDVREFWDPPSPPEHEPETVASPPPLQADVPVAHFFRKWSLWGAATIGLALASVVLAMSAFTTQGYMLANVGYAPSAGLIGELIGQLLVLPLLFVLVAVIRNTVRRRNLRPSSVSAVRGAATFFGILIVVGISLRIFGSFYFSRDEIIEGDARADFTKSFAAGCFRSQRNAVVNAGLTDTQLDSYCNCAGNSVASTFTYRQLASGDKENLRKAVEQAAPSCRGKQ
jgi:GYF domain 2